MPDVTLKSSNFGNIPPERLAALFQVLGQPATPTIDGLLISPRSVGAHPVLAFKELAINGFDEVTFTTKFQMVDSRINTDQHLEEDGLEEARASIRRWLQAGDFGQLSAKLLETTSPDMRHVWLRDLVLPIFFEMFPGGRFGAVLYDEVANGYLANLNMLLKAQILHGNAAELQKLLGRSMMSSFGLNVPAEMIWLMLSIPTLLFFPDAYIFIASCEHRYFLYFITDRPISIGQGEERYAPFARIMPRLLSVLDAQTPSRVLLDRRTILPDRTYPFNRCRYNAIQLQKLLETYVGHLNSLLAWLCEATHFAKENGDYDIAFALQTYQTVHLLLNTSVRIITEQSDHYNRKMSFFDVLELYAGLIDSRGAQRQGEAWKLLLANPVIADTQSALRSNYGMDIGTDLADATRAIHDENGRVVANGLIYGLNDDGTVNVPPSTRVPFDEYIILLLRGLRNTKHGFAIRDQSVLSIHSGAIANDLPDYVVSLWFTFVTDQSRYTLFH